MRAYERKFMDFLNPTQQGIIPMYQRKYSWLLEQCKRLMGDILEVGKDKSRTKHFLGSIVYKEENSSNPNDIKKLSIIDGQQRITTVTLLLAALADYLRDNPNEDLPSFEALLEFAVINRNHENTSNYFKLCLRGEDNDVLKDIILSVLHGESLNPKFSKSLLFKNYNYFRNFINENNINKIYIGLNNLWMMDMSLDSSDNPQNVFESLNSTGLSLKQVDLVKNYLFMGLNLDAQERIHSKYWKDMEFHFEEASPKMFDRFLRDYLTVKIGKKCSTHEVYDIFRKFSKSEFSNEVLCIMDLCKYAEFYRNIALGNEKDEDLHELFDNLKIIRMIVCRPFLLKCYEDYYNHKLYKEEFVELLKVLESYLLRRSICELTTTQGLDGFFANLHRYIDRKCYVDSLKRYLISLDANTRFPTDEEVYEKLTKLNFTKYTKNRFVLTKLENYGDKEKIDINNKITIEHIMPQTLDEIWKENLGDNYEEIHETYVNRIGNFTLTGHNSELSNRSFSIKKEMDGGYGDSKFKLSRDLCNYENWGKSEILKRTEELCINVIKIWKYPKVEKDSLLKYSN